MFTPLKTVLASLLLLAVVNSGRAQVGVSFVKPLPSQPVDSSFTVQVQCSSPVYAITSVMAIVQGRSTALTYLSSSNYSGVLSLAGLAKDSVYTVTVVAKNANGDSGVISEPVIYDPPPVLTVIKPYWGAVGRPTLDFKATCAPTAGHCQITVKIYDGTTAVPVGTFTDSVNTSFDVSAYQGKTSLEFELTAKDQYNVQSVQGGDFYVETSPYLTPLYTANNPINGFLGNNLLVNNLQLIDSPHIVNYTTGVSTTVPFKGLIPFTGGESISSRGMVFLGQHVDQTGAPVGQQTIYDWNNGTLDSLGWPASGYLKASGNYATWIGDVIGGGLYIRDLVSHTTQFINPTSNNTYDLDSSGAVAYANLGYPDSVILYSNGVSTPVKIQRTSDSLAGVPLTDGKSVVYLKQGTGVNNNKYIYLYDAKSGTNMLLSDLGSPSHPDIIFNEDLYRIKNGYTAYLKPDAGFKYQAWVRDTVGNNTQASFFSLSSKLERMAPNGQLAFLNAAATTYGYRYIFDKTAGLTPISSQPGLSYYQDTSWYLTVGNTLFRVNLHITPDKADSFSVDTQKDSAYIFTANEFASEYQTSGSLMSVAISRLPAHGTLKLNGANVAVNQVIPRASLSNLVFFPTSGFTGSDTVVWTGSNGFTPSPAPVPLVVNIGVLSPPPAPVISGMQVHYCPTAGQQKIKITNIPAPSYQVTVTVKVNGQVTTVGSDSSFIIRPDTLAAGPYTVMVVFKNATAGDTTKQTFNVDAEVTPQVHLNSNITTVTDLSQQVMLTASNTAGGGTTPLYTFSKDRTFATNVQAEGSSATYSFDPSTLVVGNNNFYVRMRTSEVCYSAQTGVDSIVIIRSTVTGIVDVDYPDQVINVYSNPFVDHLHITGLQSFKNYTLTLVRSNGQVVVRRQATGQQEVNIETGVVAAGVYLLNIYDIKKGRLIGTAKLLSLGK